MSAEINYEEYLLRHDFKKLLVHYQDLIARVVGSMAGSGYFMAGETKDVIQEVNLHLLSHEAQFRKNYQERSTIRMYFATVIKRHCHDIALKKKKVISTVELEELHERLPAGEATQLSRLIIKDEVIRLGKILETYPRQKPRIELMLKLTYRVPLEHHDLINAYPKIPMIECSSIAKKINLAISSTSKEVFECFSDCIKKYDPDPIQSRSISRWINGIIQDLIGLMNGGSIHQTHYDNEAFQLIVEHYFRKN